MGLKVVLAGDKQTQGNAQLTKVVLITCLFRAADKTLDAIMDVLDAIMD